MSKKQIYIVRNQVQRAMSEANDDKVAYSPLIRKGWERYGYVPVSAYNLE